jgi:hypothetical protein
VHETLRRKNRAAPALAGRSGLYFNGLREARADPQAYDAAARRKLRALSLELTGLSSAAAGAKV